MMIFGLFQNHGTILPQSLHFGKWKLLMDAVGLTKRRMQVTHTLQRIALCFALPCGETRQSRGQLLSKEGSTYPLIEKTPRFRPPLFLKLMGSIPQYDTLRKRTFLNFSKIFDRNVKKLPI